MPLKCIKMFNQPETVAWQSTISAAKEIIQINDTK